ncbi:MAG: hypothetical protein L3J95_04915 [Thermoplasmata archaeon]|nr:hypothetical protein [Thermoplasmata archaeon]
MRVASTGRRRLCYRRGFRRDSRGVVSVVGTLLALLVFFALFGVFLTQYVPLWMSENEQTLTTQVETALANLKGGIDGQVASQGPAVIATPFPISSQSIPLIAQPTAAAITFVPPSPGGGTYSNVSMKPGPGGSTGAFFENQTVGTVQIKIPSRYYSPETFLLENDAIIQSQGNGQQVVEFPPTLSVNQTGSGYGVTASLIQVTGISTQATGVGTQEIFSHFVYSDAFTSTSAAGTLTAKFIEATFYPCAWSSFVTSTFAQAPSGFSSHYTITAPGSCSGPPATSYPFKVAFTGLTSFTLIWAEVHLVIGVGTE